MEADFDLLLTILSLCAYIGDRPREELGVTDTGADALARHGPGLASRECSKSVHRPAQGSTGLLQAPQVPRSCDRVRFDDEMEKALYFSSGAAATAVNRTADRMWSWSMIIHSPLPLAGCFLL